RGLAAVESDEDGVDVRDGPKDLAAHLTGELDVGVPGGLRARGAIHLRAGAGREAVADLGLDHDEDALDRLEALEEMEDDGDAHVVREVGDEGGRERLAPARARTGMRRLGAWVRRREHSALRLEALHVER